MDRFIQAFEEALDLAPGSVDSETEFKTMAEWDSLAQISTMTIIEEIYGKFVDSAFLSTRRTIGDLIAGIEAA